MLKTVQQVAEELQCSEESVRIWIRRGKLKAYTTGKSYRISEEQLQEFLESDNKTKQG